MTRASETAPADRRRVVVWSTGGVGSNAIRAIAGRRDLELVGVWVHTPGKVWRDAECTLTLGPPEGHEAGEAAMTATAMRVVNAVPHVVDAAPGPPQFARRTRHHPGPRLPPTR